MPTAPATSSPDRDGPRGVLVTRPVDAAQETAARLVELGWEPILAPCLEIETRAIEPPVSADAILVTSGNALPALPEALRGLPLLAVGDATAARAASLGFRDVRSAAGDASALAALAAATLAPRARLLLPSGAGQGAALAAALTRAGFALDHRVAYRARPAGALPESAVEALRGGALRAATFLSAETALAFVRLLPTPLRDRLVGVDALAISEAAADAARALPWRRVRVSASATLEGTLALL